MNHMKLTSTNLSDSLECPTSKSYAARALILAALSKDDITLLDLPTAQDTLDLIRCLKIIGLSIKTEGSNSLTVSGSFPRCEIVSDQIEMNLGEGGTTIRFLLPLLALGRAKYKLTFMGGMVSRPMQELYQTLKDINVSIVTNGSGLEIQGPIDSAKASVLDCTHSSQFASGIEMINAFYPLKITYSNLKLSKKYFEMTEFVVEELKNNSTFQIPVDFSSAGYLIAYAVLSKSLVINNIKYIDEFQADSILISILNDMGVKLKLDPIAGLRVSKAEKILQGFIIDGSCCIDLVPTLAFIAAHIPVKSKISHIKGLIHKESNRLAETLSILNHFGVNHEYSEESDSLTITGKKIDEYTQDQLGSYDPPNDHRMVMIASLFLKIRGGGTVSNRSSVKKSFPDFFSYFY